MLTKIRDLKIKHFYSNKNIDSLLVSCKRINNNSRMVSSQESKTRKKKYSDILQNDLSLVERIPLLQTYV